MLSAISWSLSIAYQLPVMEDSQISSTHRSTHFLFLHVFRVVTSPFVVRLSLSVFVIKTTKCYFQLSHKDSLNKITQTGELLVLIIPNFSHRTKKSSLHIFKHSR